MKIKIQTYMANKINEEPVSNEAVKSTISKAEQFYEGNKKIILIIFCINSTLYRMSL